MGVDIIKTAAAGAPPCMQSALAAAGEHRGCSQFTLCISHLNQTCYGTTRFLLMMMIYIMTQFMYDLAVKRRGSSVLHGGN